MVGMFQVDKPEPRVYGQAFICKLPDSVYTPRSNCIACTVLRHSSTCHIFSTYSKLLQVLYKASQSIKRKYARNLESCASHTKLFPTRRSALFAILKRTANRTNS